MSRNLYKNRYFKDSNDEDDYKRDDNREIYNDQCRACIVCPPSDYREKFDSESSEKSCQDFSKLCDDQPRICCEKKNLCKKKNKNKVHRNPEWSAENSTEWFMENSSDKPAEWSEEKNYDNTWDKKWDEDRCKSCEKKCSNCVQCKTCTCSQCSDYSQSNIISAMDSENYSRSDFEFLACDKKSKSRKLDNTHSKDAKNIKDIKDIKPTENTEESDSYRKYDHSNNKYKDNKDIKVTENTEESDSYRKYDHPNNKYEGSSDNTNSYLQNKKKWEEFDDKIWGEHSNKMLEESDKKRWEESDKKRWESSYESASSSTKGKKFVITFGSKEGHPWADYNIGDKSIHINGKNGPVLHLYRGYNYFFCIDQNIRDGEDPINSFVLTNSPIGGLDSKVIINGFAPVSKGCVAFKVDKYTPRYFFYQDSKSEFQGGLVIVHDSQ
jgi:hypothetical protein